VETQLGTQHNLDGVWGVFDPGFLIWNTFKIDLFEKDREEL